MLEFPTMSEWIYGFKSLKRKRSEQVLKDIGVRRPSEKYAQKNRCPGLGTI